MKKHFLFKLAIAMAAILLISCSKNKNAGGSTPPPNPLAGQEFIFDNLTWTFFNSGSPSFDELTVVTPARPDLFRYVPAQVFIQFDTTAGWTEVRNQYFQGQTYQQVFQLSFDRLIVYSFPVSQPLAGRRASVRVRF